LTQCLRKANYGLPSLRYVIYGRPGCGKSTTLAYAMHYCGRAGWYIVHEPWLPHPLRYAADVEPSVYTPGLATNNTTMTNQGFYRSAKTGRSQAI